jgi:hypothetical protein
LENNSLLYTSVDDIVFIKFKVKLYYNIDIQKNGGEMLTVRLPDNLEHLLNVVSQTEKKTKTQIVKEALQAYIVDLQSKKKQTPYELGKDLFGTCGSGDGSLSTTYKEKLTTRLNEKYHR